MADGAFEIAFPGLSSFDGGTLTLRVDGFVPVNVTLTGDETTVDLGRLVLSKGSTIRGRVEDVNGYIASGAFTSVSLETPTFKHVFQTALAKDGTFELRGVPSEAATLSVSVAVPGAGSDEWLEAKVKLDPAAVARGDVGVLRLAPAEKK